MKKLQTTQKSGVEVQKTEQSAAWVLEHLVRPGFPSEIISDSGNRTPLGAGRGTGDMGASLAAALGTWVRAWPRKKGPLGRADQRSRLQAPREPAEDCFISK